MKKTTLIFILIPIIFLALLSASYAQYSIIQITNNYYSDHDQQINNSGQVVWVGRETQDLGQGMSRDVHKIFVYDSSTATTTQIVNNSYPFMGFYPQINDSGQVVWQGNDGNDWGIFIYDIATAVTTQFSNSYTTGLTYPQINDSGQVVWSGNDGNVCEIFIYDISTATNTQITNGNSALLPMPKINDNGQVVWQGQDGHDLEIFMYDSGTATTTQITYNSSDDRLVQINNSGHVVWVDESTDHKIFMHDIATAVTTQIANYDSLYYNGVYPQINDSGQVAYYGYDGNDWVIFIYDIATAVTTQIANYDSLYYDPMYLQINNSGQVVYYGYELIPDVAFYSGIFLYDITTATTTQITDDPSGGGAKIKINDSGHVVWMEYDAFDPDIFLAIPCSINNDYDEDGYISTGCGGDDCNDSNIDIHINASEVCDNLGADEDCDGMIDADDPDCAPSCTDNDEDGYSIGGGMCGEIDCNDSNTAINPGASEVCDDLGADEDCDGMIDDDDPDCAPSCTDNDEDGYSIEGGMCGEIDCNDSNDQVNPGGEEIPNNGIDDDCNPNTPSWGTPASVVNAEYKEFSDIANCLFLLCIPVGAVLLWKGLRRRK